jgi:hypothetical protein
VWIQDRQGSLIKVFFPRILTGGSGKRIRAGRGMLSIRVRF